MGTAASAQTPRILASEYCLTASYRSTSWSAGIASVRGDRGMVGGDIEAPLSREGEPQPTRAAASRIRGPEQKLGTNYVAIGTSRTLRVWLDDEQRRQATRRAASASRQRRHSRDQAAPSRL